MEERFSFESGMAELEEIVSALEKGEMSLTHLSDVLRCELLRRHGGLWIDATVYTIMFVSPGHVISRFPPAAATSSSREGSQIALPSGLR